MSRDEINPEVASQLARSILRKTLGVRRGEDITIESYSSTLPWANACVLEARRIGAHPILLYEDTETYWKSVDAGPAKEMGTVGQHEWGALAKTDAYVFFFGPPDREARLRNASDKKRQQLLAYNGSWYDRAEKAKVRAARVYLGQIGEESAKRWDLDPVQWEEETIAATVADPTPMVKLGAKLAKILKTGKKVEVSHENGTDLQLRFAGRTPVVDDGVVDAADVKAGRNVTPIPSGVVTLSVDERFAEGTLQANHKSCLPRGAVHGGRWTFAGGHLKEFSYESGAERFSEAYKKRGPGGDRPGTFAIGLNPAIHDLPQMEDQIYGNVTVAIGGNGFYDGKNTNAEFGSWLSLGGGTVRIDGKTVVDAGRITL